MAAQPATAVEVAGRDDKTTRRASLAAEGELEEQTPAASEYLLLKTRKGKRALATVFGRLPKARVITTPSNAPAKNRIAGVDATTAGPAPKTVSISGPAETSDEHAAVPDAGTTAPPP